MRDLTNREYVGNSLIFFTVVNVVLNIGLVVFQTLLLVIRKIKLKYLETK